MDRKKRLMLEIISGTFCVDPREMDGFTPTIFKNPDIQIPSIEEEKMLRDADVDIGVDKALIRPLIEINKAGIRTTGSCQGHRAGEDGWVGVEQIERDDIANAIKILRKHGIKGHYTKDGRIEFPPIIDEDAYSEFDKYVELAHDNGENAQWPFLKDKYGITREDVIDFADADQFTREKADAKKKHFAFTPETMATYPNLQRLIKLDWQGKTPTVHKALERIERRHHNTKRHPMKRNKSARMIIGK